MFKLTKILSSGSSLIEPIRLPIDSAYRYTVGAVAILHDGRLIPARATDTPTHLIGESIGDKRSGKIIAYEITPEMILEVEISENPRHLRIGQRLRIDDTLGMSDSVIEGIGGKAIVIDTNGAQRAGDRLYVIFPERKES